MTGINLRQRRHFDQRHISPQKLECNPPSAHEASCCNWSNDPRLTLNRQEAVCGEPNGDGKDARHVALRSTLRESHLPI